MRPHGISNVFIGFTAVLSVAVWGTAQSPRRSPVIPTPLKAQIQRGEQVYLQSCQKCHGNELQGLRGPTLRGQEFLARWATIGNLHAKISTTMPRSAPASLAPQDYLDVLAFIVNKNGVPLGTRGLGASSFKQKLTGK